MTLWSRLKAFVSGWPESEAQEEPKKPHLQSMTKKQLEEYGRTIGIEVDRRHNKKKIIKTLQSSW
jgi:hypothetical protein